MGNKKNETGEKVTLIDFIYKDTNLINSFYSQIFGGDLTAIQKSELSLDETNSSMGANAAFIKGDVVSKHSNNQTITQSINPYDSKVIELLEEFNLQSSSLYESENGSIIAIKGSITYRNYDILNTIMPLILKMDLVPGFNNPLNPDAKGKSKKITIGNLITDLIKLLPYGVEFELHTIYDETATCIIKPEGLTISANDLFRSYGNAIPGTWTIIGIVDSSENRDTKCTNEFKSGLDSSIKAFSEMFLNADDTVIRPIAIYRHLSL